MRARLLALCGLLAAAAGNGCSDPGADFDGDTLVFPDDLPVSTTKDFASGDLGGVADWYEILGATGGAEYTVYVGLSPAEGDDLHFTVVKDPHDFGPENDYCHGLARADESGPSCTFTAEDDVFYLYVMRGFVEDGVTQIDYTLSITSSGP